MHCGGCLTQQLNKPQRSHQCLLKTVSNPEPMAMSSPVGLLNSIFKSKSYISSCLKGSLFPKNALDFFHSWTSDLFFSLMEKYPTIISAYTCLVMASTALMTQMVSIPLEWFYLRLVKGYMLHVFLSYFVYLKYLPVRYCSVSYWFEWTCFIFFQTIFSQIDILWNISLQMSADMDLHTAFNFSDSHTS